MWSLFHEVIAINIWCAETSFGINTTCFVHLKLSSIGFMDTHLVVQHEIQLCYVD
jgi:hypothetical protein